MITTAHKSTALFGWLGACFLLCITAAFYTEQYWVAAIPFALILFYAGWQHKEKLFYLLLFTLPLSFEYSFSSSLGTDVPDELLMVLVSILYFGYWCYSPRSIPKETLQHPLLLLLIAALVWTLVTILFSFNPLLSFKYLLAKGWYIGAFVLAPLVVWKEKKTIITSAGLLAGVMLLIAAIALIRHSQYGFRFAMINEAVAPFFRNHVNYSAMLVCCIPIILAAYRLSQNKTYKQGLLVLLAIAITALFFSYARGAWLALLAGLLTYGLIRKRWVMKTFFAAIAVVVLSILWLKSDDHYLDYAHNYKTTIFHSDFSEHLVATYQLRDVSTAERFYRWIAGVRMIKDNWLTGYGPNNFYHFYQSYTIPAYKTWVSNNPDHSTVHNYFLLLAIEQGMPGLLFFLLLLAALFYYSQYLYHRIVDPFYRTAALTAGVILAMIVVLNFLSDLIETDKVGSLFFLCLATLLVCDSNTRKRSDPAPNVQGIS